MGLLGRSRAGSAEMAADSRLGLLVGCCYKAGLVIVCRRGDSRLIPVYVVFMYGRAAITENKIRLHPDLKCADAFYFKVYRFVSCFQEV